MWLFNKKTEEEIIVDAFRRLGYDPSYHSYCYETYPDCSPHNKPPYDGKLYSQTTVVLAPKVILRMYFKDDKLKGLVTEEHMHTSSEYIELKRDKIIVEGRDIERARYARAEEFIRAYAGDWENCWDWDFHTEAEKILEDLDAR